MKERLRMMWQTKSASTWEPGEQVELAQFGWLSQRWWQSPMFVGPLVQSLAGWSRVFILTDRNVYLVRPSATKGGVVKEVLVKRPRAEAALTFHRRRLTLDGGEAVFIPLFGRKRAQAMVDAVGSGHGLAATVTVES